MSSYDIDITESSYEEDLEEGSYGNQAEENINSQERYSKDGGVSKIKKTHYSQYKTKFL